MNPASKFSFPAVLDPVVAAFMGQLEEQVEAQDRVIAEKSQALAAAEVIIQQLKEARSCPIFSCSCSILNLLYPATKSKPR
jgi:hypothetical protein